MRFVVLGARGSIGSAVVRHAALEDHEVRAVVRDPARPGSFPEGTEVAGADLLDGPAVESACRDADVVVHAGNAPYPAWPEQVPRMGLNALKAAEKAGALLAFPGNVYVYGRPRTRPVTEDHPMEPHTTKGKIRLALERELLQAHREGRARVVLPRYPDFYGPGIAHEFVRSILEGALTGKGCRWPVEADAPHEFILIEDAAIAMLRLIETPDAHGMPVHVPGPGTITPREFVGHFYRLGGHEPRLQVYGRGTWRLVGLFDRMARSAYEMAYLFDDPVLLDGGRYRSLVGSPPPTTPYAEGARIALDWYRAHRSPA